MTHTAIRHKVTPMQGRAALGQNMRRWLLLGSLVLLGGCSQSIDNECHAERDICPEGYHCVDGSCLRDVPGHWVGLPSGSFTIGSPDDENGRDPAGETEHEVTLTRRFEISETEVTPEACG